MPTPTATLEFKTPEEATAWMLDTLDKNGEEYMDNERFAFLDDPSSVARYDQQAATGCCGGFDREIIVAGRPAQVGCNYGH